MSVYSQLPETSDIQLARTISEQQSEVAYVQYFSTDILECFRLYIYCVCGCR